MSTSAILGRRRLLLFLCTNSINRMIKASGPFHTLLLSHSLRPMTSKSVSVNSEEGGCFTVSYLMRKCELSLESAKSVSTHLTLKNQERADSVISLLKEHGFTNAQISKFIKWQPFLLVTNPEERILPKLEFFRSMGCSNARIVFIFSRSPNLLMTSVLKRIVPCYDIIKSVLLIDSTVNKSFECNLSHCGPEPAVLALNIQAMRDHGLPDSSISAVVRHFLHILFQRPSKFGKILNEVDQMGFDPSKTCFILATSVISYMSLSTVESKLNLLKSFGMSRDEAWAVFKKRPLIMNISKEKMSEVLGFLLNQMSWKLQDIVVCPRVFEYSLEKRTAPRSYVARALLSKGLQKEIKLSTLLDCSEEIFVKKYVTKYLKTMPQLLDLYKGKVSLNDL